MLPAHLPALPATPALSKATGLGPPPGEVEGVSQGQVGGQLALSQTKRGGQHHLGRGQADGEGSPREANPLPTTQCRQPSSSRSWE